MDHLVLGFTLGENIGGWVVTIGLVFIFGYYFKNPDRDRKKRNQDNELK
ncbi:hypothetical protein [Neobacillus cucumis]|nr:hypothetical protein [Neobacillus cucumis]MBM7653000.1 hypothetical protein [Neobacillus cucumis]